MKIRRGRNGLTKAEFLQREAKEEVAKRVDELLEKIVEKRKAVKSEAEGEQK